MGYILHLLLPASFPCINFPSSFSSSSHTKTLILFLVVACKTPKGFSPIISTQKSKNRKQRKSLDPYDDEEEGDDDVDERDEATGFIPEVVMNRINQQMGLLVCIPLGINILFFPFFYYLKAVVKINVPTRYPSSSHSFL